MATFLCCAVNLTLQGWPVRKPSDGTCVDVVPPPTRYAAAILGDLESCAPCASDPEERAACLAGEYPAAAAVRAHGCRLYSTGGWHCSICNPTEQTSPPTGSTVHFDPACGNDPLETPALASLRFGAPNVTVVGNGGTIIVPRFPVIAPRGLRITNATVIAANNPPVAPMAFVVSYPGVSLLDVTTDRALSLVSARPTHSGAPRADIAGLQVRGAGKAYTAAIARTKGSADIDCTSSGALIVQDNKDAPAVTNCRHIAPLAAVELAAAAAHAPGGAVPKGPPQSLRVLNKALGTAAAAAVVITALGHEGDIRRAIGTRGSA